MMIYWHFHIWSHTTSHTCRPVGRIRSGHVPIVCGDCLGKLLRSILASPQFWRTLMLVCIVHCQTAAAKNQLLQFWARFFSEGDFLMGHKSAPLLVHIQSSTRPRHHGDIFWVQRGLLQPQKAHPTIFQTPRSTGSLSGGLTVSTYCTFVINHHRFCYCRRFRC